LVSEQQPVATNQLVQPSLVVKGGHQFDKNWTSQQGL
jgi:hypothetical protein